MSKKINSNEINPLGKKIANKNINLDIINKSENQNIRVKRKKMSKIKNNQNCSRCMKKSRNIMVFNSKEELIDKIKILLKNKIINYKEKLIMPIQQIKGFNSNLICKKCFEQMIFGKDCINEIKEIFFQDVEKIYNGKLSLNIRESSSQIDIRDNNINNINNNMIYDIDIVEYNECLENIVQYFKISFLQFSFFANSFKIFTTHFNSINNISQNKLNIEYFFHSYIHAKAILENFYILINKIIIKFKNVTNRIIGKLKLTISNESNEDLKSTFDIFVNNTNLILANILNFVNNYKICLCALRCSNDINDIGR